jgi:ABC-2 type transport system ATP-binding protein
MGKDVTRQPLDVRRLIAVVLQQAAVETLLTVRDNLLIYAYLHGIGRREATFRLQAVVEEFGLGEKLNETVYDLSIGTKRRVQVAKIFMVDAPVIFLDEATTGMDPLMKRRVMERIRAEAVKGRTILLTTQVLSEAEQLCDTILIVDRGRTRASGTLQELRDLSARMFRVSLTFADMNGDLLQRLQALGPMELKADGKIVEMLFQGEEASLLGALADISRFVAITHFEIRGADLEEIFMRLLKEPA